MKFPFKTLKKEYALPQPSSFLLYIFVLALVLRVLNLYFSGENPLMYMPVLDEKYYVLFGKAVSNGEWVGENRVSFMDPLYGYFLGGVFFLLGDNLTMVRLLQILLDSFNVILIYMIGAKLWKKDAGLVAAFAYALYPLALFYSLLILKTTLTTTMLLLFTLYLLHAVEKPGRLSWYGLGLLASLMTHLRANMVLLVPMAILMMPLFQRLDWKRFFGSSLFLLLGFVSMLPLGIVRNYWASGELSVLNSQAGRLFYSCNNPENLTGRYNVPRFVRPNSVDSETDFHVEAERRKGVPLNSSQVSRYWMTETFQFLWKNPALIPNLLYCKIKGTIGACEIANNHSFYVAASFSPVMQWMPNPFAIVLSFGLPGLFLGMKRSRQAFVLLVPLMTVLVTIIIFYTSSRFRMPTVPFLMVGLGISFSVLKDWFRAKKFRRAGLLIIFTGISGYLSLLIACPKPAGTEEFFLSKAYWHQKDYKNARRIALDGLKAFPEQPRFYVLLGMIAFSENRPDEAKMHYREALRIDPDNVDALYNLGLVYLGTKRAGRAIEFFQKTLSLKEKPDIFFYLAKALEEKGDQEAAAKHYRRYLENKKGTDLFRKKAEKSYDY